VIFQEVRRVETAHKNKRSCKQAFATVKRYEDCCENLGLPAYPFTYQSVSSFLVAHVIKNGGSTKSVANVKSHLRTTAMRRSMEWLSGADAAKLSDLVRELQLEDLEETDRKLPLTTEVILLMLQYLDFDVDTDLLEATIIVVGHDGLFRSGELCSALRKEDIVWWTDDDGFSVLLGRTKTHRSGGKAKVDIPDNASPYSAVKLLRQWWDRWELKGKPESTVIFPNIIGGQNPRLGDGTATLSWLRRAIKRGVSRVGLDPQRYSGHSLRAGGATDLFVARVPYFIIKEMGRWTTDAALIYYRADYDVRRAVKRAFSKVAKSCLAVGVVTK
jgi:hypothetical protein